MYILIGNRSSEEQFQVVQRSKLLSREFDGLPFDLNHTLLSTK